MILIRLGGQDVDQECAETEVSAIRKVLLAPKRSPDRPKQQSAARTRKAPANAKRSEDEARGGGNAKTQVFSILPVVCDVSATVVRRAGP